MEDLEKFKQLRNRIVTELRRAKQTFFTQLLSYIPETKRNSVTPYVTKLFSTSIRLGELPDEWKVARVTPIPKSDNHSDPGNCRPISLLSILSKLLA